MMSEATMHVRSETRYVQAAMETTLSSPHINFLKNLPQSPSHRPKLARMQMLPALKRLAHFRGDTTMNGVKQNERKMNMQPMRKAITKYL